MVLDRIKIPHLRKLAYFYKLTRFQNRQAIDVAYYTDIKPALAILQHLGDVLQDLEQWNAETVALIWPNDETVQINDIDDAAFDPRIHMWDDGTRAVVRRWRKPSASLSGAASQEEYFQLYFWGQDEPFDVKFEAVEGAIMATLLVSSLAA